MTASLSPHASSIPIVVVELLCLASRLTRLRPSRESCCQELCKSPPGEGFESGGGFLRGRLGELPLSVHDGISGQQQVELIGGIDPAPVGAQPGRQLEHHVEHVAADPQLTFRDFRTPRGREAEFSTRRGEQRSDPLTGLAGTCSSPTHPSWREVPTRWLFVRCTVISLGASRFGPCWSDALLLRASQESRAKLYAGLYYELTFAIASRLVAHDSTQDALGPRGVTSLAGCSEFWSGRIGSKIRADHLVQAVKTRAQWSQINPTSIRPVAQPVRAGFL